MSVINLSAADRKVMFLSSLGGALEFYDFIIYAFMASTLSELFFPQLNHLTALMSTYAVFAVGYIIRPLGGIVFSHLGDKYGRKKTFVTTLIMMALPTFLIGLLPTHAMIGIFAPVLLIMLRMLQGFSMGGEIPGAITFAGEHVHPKRRGLTCAVIFFGINCGLIMGSVVSLALVMLCTHEQIIAWGWRLPFIFGGVLGFLSLNLRKKLSETPVFQLAQQHAQKTAFPLLEILRNYRLQIFQGVALTWLDAVTVYLLYIYLPNYLISILHYPAKTISILNTCALILNSFIFVMLGWLSDHLGRRVFLLIGSMSFIIFGYAMFYLVAKQQLVYVVIVMIAIAIFSGFISGIYMSVLIELFPTPVRYTGLAISYNIGYAFFGGFAPLIATGLIAWTGNILAPSYYLIVSAIVCFLGALTLKKYARTETLTIQQLNI